MGDFEVFNHLYLMIFLHARSNKAGIHWLLGCGVPFIGVFFHMKAPGHSVP